MDPEIEIVPVPSKVIYAVTDMLPLPSALEFACMCFKPTSRCILRVIKRHNGDSLLAQCVAEDELEKLTPDMLERIWTAIGTGFPWDKFLCVCAVRQRLPLVRFICYNAERMLPDLEIVGTLHSGMMHNIRNKQLMLDEIGLSAVPLAPISTLEPEEELALYTKVWHRLTKLVVKHSTRDPMYMVTTMCGCEHSHLPEWLSWFVCRFKPNDLNITTRYIATATLEALFALVANDAVYKMQIMLESTWVKSRRLDLREVMTAAIDKGNVKMVMIIYQKSSVQPSPEDHQKMTPSMQSFFKYALNPARNIHEDYRALSSRIATRLDDFVRVLAEEEQARVEELPDVVQLREQFKRKRQEQQQKCDADHKRYRKNYLALASVLTV